MVMRGMIPAAAWRMQLVEVGAAPAVMVCSQRHRMRSLLLEQSGV